MSQNILRPFVTLFVAAIYALSLANIEVILGVSESDIKDRLNYLNYFFVHVSLIESLPQGNIISFFASEPAFSFLWVLLSRLVSDESLALSILIFSSALVAAFVIMERRDVPFLWKVLILVFPWFLVNYIMTLRQGVAIAVLLYSHFYLTGRWKWIAYAVTPLIHYSFFLVLGVLILSNVLSASKVTNAVRLVALNGLVLWLSSLILAVVNGWIPTPVMEFESLVLGYADKVAGGFGFGILYWGGVLTLMLASERDFIKNNLASIFAITLYLCGALFFSPMSRVLQSFSPIILLVGFQLTGYRLVAFKGLLLLHVIYFFATSLYEGGPSGMLVEVG